MANEIKVTPIDIQQKRFPVAFRGYDRTEVEMFLDLVREEVESLVREVAEQKEFRQSYDDRVRELNGREEMVKNTMLMTQRLMEDQKDNARREAAVVIQDAKVQSQQMIGNAQQEKLKLEAEIQDLKRRKHHVLLDIRTVAKKHLEMPNFEEAGEGASDGPDKG